MEFEEYTDEFQLFSLPGYEKKRKEKQNQNQKRKRKQVKKACANCRNAHTGCDHERPCKRCVGHGLEDSCVDVKRKTSKKDFEETPKISKKKEKTVLNEVLDSVIKTEKKQKQQQVEEEEEEEEEKVEKKVEKKS